MLYHARPSTRHANTDLFDVILEPGDLGVGLHQLGVQPLTLGLRVHPAHAERLDRVHKLQKLCRRGVESETKPNLRVAKPG